jgi:hypothetical protein
MVRNVKIKLRWALQVGGTFWFRTQKKRWEKVAVAGRPEWDIRNEKIARLIPPGSYVIDLGSGAQTLRHHLPIGTKYQPCDLVKSSTDVLLCDFNANQFPNVGCEFTHVVCSGVLEYIRDPVWFLGKCSELDAVILLSYNLRSAGDSKLHRMTNNWINHFSQTELEQIFSMVGLCAKCLDHSQTDEVIYELTLSKNE